MVHNNHSYRGLSLTGALLGPYGLTAFINIPAERPGSHRSPLPAPRPCSKGSWLSSARCFPAQVRTLFRHGRRYRFHRNMGPTNGYFPKMMNHPRQLLSAHPSRGNRYLVGDFKPYEKRLVHIMFQTTKQIWCPCWWFILMGNCNHILLVTLSIRIANILLANSTN